MKTYGTLILAGALICAGCVSKARARREAQAAYAAGRQEALSHIQQIRGPSVTVAGPVRSPFVDWTPELTVAKAIVAAVYYGPTDPVQVTIVRDGKEIEVDPGRLLQGEDTPLLAGDIIKIR